MSGDGDETDDDVAIVSVPPTASQSRKPPGSSAAASAAGGGGADTKSPGRASSGGGGGGGGGAAVGTDLDPETEWELAVAAFREELESSGAGALRLVPSFNSLIEKSRKLMRPAPRSNAPHTTTSATATAATPTGKSNGHGKVASGDSSAAAASSGGSKSVGQPLIVFPEVQSAAPRGKWRVSITGHELILTTLTTAKSKPTSTAAEDDEAGGGGGGGGGDTKTPAASTELVIPLSRVVRLILVPVPPSSASASFTDKSGAKRSSSEYNVVLGVSRDLTIGKTKHRLIVFSFCDPKTGPAISYPVYRVIWAYRDAPAAASAVIAGIAGGVVTGSALATLNTLKSTFQTQSSVLSDRKHGRGLCQLMADTFTQSIVAATTSGGGGRKTPLRVDSTSEVFTSVDRSGAVHATYKSNGGHLYLMDCGIVFLRKPIIFVHSDDIDGISSSRGGSGTVGHTFDLSITLAESLTDSLSSAKMMGGEEIGFAMIPKNEETGISHFLARFAKRRQRENALVEAGSDAAAVAAITAAEAGGDDDWTSAAGAGGSGSGGHDPSRRNRAASASGSGGGSDSEEADADYKPGADPSESDGGGESDASDEGGEFDADDASDSDHKSKRRAPPKPKSKPKSKPKRKRAGSEDDAEDDVSEPDSDSDAKRPPKRKHKSVAPSSAAAPAPTDDDDWEQTPIEAFRAVPASPPPVATTLGLHRPPPQKIGVQDAIAIDDD